MIEKFVFYFLFLTVFGDEVLIYSNESEITSETNESETPVPTTTTASVEEEATVGEIDSAQGESGNEELSILLPDKVQPLIQIKDHLSAVNNKDSEKKKYMEKQINPKHPMTRVVLHQTIEAIYNCTQDSALSLLSMRLDFDNYFACNQVLDLSNDIKINATIKSVNNRNTVLTAYDSTAQVVFYKGNQIFYTSARVDSGYCNGDKLVINNIGLAKRGTCNSRSGVQQIISDYAMLTVSGRCRSTCFGDVNVSINPGLRS